MNNMSELEKVLNECLEIAERIRNVINNPTTTRFNNYGIITKTQNRGPSLDLFIQKLYELTPLAKEYSLNLSEQIKLNISILKEPNGGLNPFQFGGIINLLHLLRKELDGKISNVANKPVPKENKQIQIFIGHGHHLIWARIGLFLSDILNIKPRYFEDSNKCSSIIPEEIDNFVNDSNIKMGIFTLMKEIQSKDGKWLPRPNVIDEAARFATKLGKDRVILVVENGVEIPSNLQGILYLPFDGDEDGLVLKIKDKIERERESLL